MGVQKQERGTVNFETDTHTTFVPNSASNQARSHRRFGSAWNCLGKISDKWVQNTHLLLNGVGHDECIPIDIVPSSFL